MDFVVVRENTEGIYTGMGGVQYKGTAAEVSTQINCTTRFGAERAVRYAFELCPRRNSAKKMLTLVHKTNVLTFAGDTWFRAFHEIGERTIPTSSGTTTTWTPAACGSSRTPSTTT